MNNWYRQLWFDFRMGHSTYLIFLLSFGTFVTVQYKLLFQNISFINELIPNITTFILLFVAIYLPVAIIIGHFHLRKQVPIESIRLTEESPYTYEVIPKSKEYQNFQYRLFEIDMLELLLNNIIKDEKEKLKFQMQINKRRNDYKMLLSGSSTKELL